MVSYNNDKRKQLFVHLIQNVLPTDTISMNYLCPLTLFRQVQGLPVGTVC